MNRELIESFRKFSEDHGFELVLSHNGVVIESLIRGRKVDG